VKRSLIALAALAVASASAFAGDFSSKNIGVEGKLGFPGVGLSFNGPINDSWNWRFDTTYGELDKSKTIDGVRYTADFKAQYNTLAAEFKPWKDSGFYLVGGLALGKTKASLSANINEPISFNGVTYNAGDLASVSGEIKSRSNTALFLGVGKRFGDADKAGWYGNWEVGGYLRQFKATLSATCSDALATSNPAACDQLATDVAAEQAKLNDDVKKLKFLPAFSIAIGYRF